MAFKRNLSDSTNECAQVEPEKEERCAVRWLNNNLCSHCLQAGGHGVRLQLLKKHKAEAEIEGWEGREFFLSSSPPGVTCTAASSWASDSHCCSDRRYGCSSLQVSGTTRPCLPHSSGSQGECDWHLWPVSHRYRPCLTPLTSLHHHHQQQSPATSRPHKDRLWGQ